MSEGSPPPVAPGPPRGTPRAEVAVDEALVRALLAQQHGDLAGLPLVLVDEGWDNVMYRLGEAYVVRLPRRAAAATLIEREQRWLPQFAGRLPVRVPAPMRCGEPGAGYPWCWSVLPWIAGEAADLEPPAESEAATLASFFRALHVPAPPEAPRNPVRGVPLVQRQAMVEARAARVAAATDALTPRLARLWQAALEAPGDDGDRWLHGDLHARNVLVERGRIVGIIDWSDLASGDRATDLAAIWGLLGTRAARRAAMEACEASEATWARARGWAYAFGMMLLDSGLADHPRHAAMGRRTLGRLDEGE